MRVLHTWSTVVVALALVSGGCERRHRRRAAPTPGGWSTPQPVAGGAPMAGVGATMPGTMPAPPVVPAVPTVAAPPPAVVPVPTGVPTGGATAALPQADQCPTAQPIAAPVTIAGDLRTATDDSHERIGVTGYAWNGPDHFFALTLAAGQAVALTLNEQGFDGGVYVFTECGNIAGSTVGGADTTPGTPFTFTAPATGRYLIAVDAWIANTSGTYTLAVTPAVGSSAGGPQVVAPGNAPPPLLGATGAFPASPASDLCTSAQPVGIPATITGNLQTAADNSHERIEVTGYAWNGGDQFFVLGLGAGQSVRLTLDEHGSFDGGLYIFTDCNSIAGSTVGGADTSPDSPLAFTAPSSGRYIIAVDAWLAGSGGPYTLSIMPGS